MSGVNQPSSTDPKFPLDTPLSLARAEYDVMAESPEVQKCPPATKDQSPPLHCKQPKAMVADATTADATTKPTSGTGSPSQLSLCF